MARVQQSNQKKKNTNQKTAPKKVASKGELAKTNPRREPSKNEILFYRIGIMVVLITIVTVAIIFTIQYFMNQEEETFVFEDQIHITDMDLKYLTYFDENSGVYADFSYFIGREDKEEILRLINANDTIYIYFYRGSNLQDEVIDKIESLNLENVAFFVLNMDLYQSIFTDQTIGHLELTEDKNQVLVKFVVDAENNEDRFVVESITRTILIELGHLE